MVSEISSVSRLFFLNTEPTEGQATGIQTSEPTGSSEPTVTEATAVVERNVGDGTDMASVIGGAVAGCVCLIGKEALNERTD